MPDELIGLLAARVAATAALPPATRTIVIPVAMTKLRVFMPSPPGFLITQNLHPGNRGSPHYTQARHSGNGSLSIIVRPSKLAEILLLTAFSGLPEFKRLEPKSPSGTGITS